MLVYKVLSDLCLLNRNNMVLVYMQNNFLVAGSKCLFMQKYLSQTLKGLYDLKMF